MCALIRLITSTWAALLLLSLTACTDRFEVRPGRDGCDAFPLQAASGAILLAGMRREKVVGVSRAGGDRGPIVYAEVSPPPEMTHVQLAAVWGESWRVRDLPKCEVNYDYLHQPATHCAVTVPHSRLVLVVSFKPGASLSDANTATQQIAQYVANDVMCGVENPS